jgi:hypothetical protein
VLAVAAAFLQLGVVIIAVPRWGVALFGIPAPDGPALAYVRAIGFRDLALALYLIALTLVGSRRALSAVLALTVVIPACDLALVAAQTGLAAPAHLALHGASAAGFAALALWIGRG